MAVMDEFKEERQALKEKPFKYKVKYFFDYYKWHVIGVIAAVVLIFTMGRDMLNSKENIFFGIFLNAYSADLEAPDKFAEEFAAFAGVDLNEYGMTFEHTMRMNQTLDSMGLEANQSIMVYMAASDLDVMVMDDSNFNKYAYKTAYSDLRNHLPAEMLEKYKDYLFYVDEVFVEEVDRISREETLDYVIEYPDYTDPGSMTSPVPVGININASEKFSEYYTYQDKPAYIGIVINTKHPELCVKLFELLFGE